MIWGPDRVRVPDRVFATHPAARRLLGLSSPFWPVLLVAVFGLIYLSHTQTVVMGYDPLGYLLAGTQLARGQGLSFVDPHSLLAGRYFAPFAFRIFQTGNPYPAYNFPPGYPAVLALVIMLWPNPEAAFYVTPLVAAGGILIIWWLGRRLLGAPAGLAAAALLGLSPLYLQFGTDLWSDLPAAVCGWLAVAFYLAADGDGLGTGASKGGGETGRSGSWRGARPRVVLLGVLSGLLLGYAAWIRYSMAVFAVPVAAYALVAFWRRRTPAAVGLLAALALTLAGLLAFNRVFYGGFLETGYSPRQGWYPWPAFNLGYALGPSPVGGYSLGASLRTFWAALGPAALLGLVGLTVMPRRRAVLIAGPAAAIWMLYAAYAFQPEGINARFLLPALPALCLGAGQALVTIGEKCGRWVDGRVAVLRDAAQKGWRDRRPYGALARVLPAALAAGAALALFVPGVRAVDTRNSSTRAQVVYAQEIAASTEPGAVLLSYVEQDRLSFYGRRSVLNFERMVPPDPVARRYRTEAFEPCLTQAITRLRRAGVPVYYVVDTDPSIWDSLDALRRNFNTEVAKESGPTIYRVLDPIAADGAPEGDACQS